MKKPQRHFISGKEIYCEEITKTFHIWTYKRLIVKKSQRHLISGKEMYCEEIADISYLEKRCIVRKPQRHFIFGRIRGLL